MREWIFTVPPEHFQWQKALIPGHTLDWPSFSRFKFEVGDLVFFYASSPVMQMVGKLKILATDVPFSECDPRNDLRKWPRTFSSRPWLRLEVLQVAPVPFKPLERDSLYYHTLFKPSPYPKLLHQNERDYLFKAFDRAMTYRVHLDNDSHGISTEALALVHKSEVLRKTAAEISGAVLASINFNAETSEIDVEVALPKHDESHVEVKILFRFGEVRSARWKFDRLNQSIGALTLKVRDIYLDFRLDGADLEILSESLEINP